MWQKLISLLLRAAALAPNFHTPSLAHPALAPLWCCFLSQEGNGEGWARLGLGGFDAIWCCSVVSVCDLTGLRDLRFSVGVGS